MRPDKVVVPLGCGFLLPIGCGDQYLARVDLELLRRAVPLFLVIFPSAIVGFFGT